MEYKEEIFVSQEELFSVVKELLREGQRARFTVSGNSMWPWLIHQRDNVVLESADRSKLKIGDIILFQTELGNYVLHRIIGKRPGGFITAGDGNLHKDGFVPREKVVARVSLIYRKNLIISCGSWRWKIISWIWMVLFPVRRYLQKGIFWIKKADKKKEISRKS